MRIVVVTSSLPPEGKGGAEGYAAMVAETLADRHEVLVMSGASEGDIGEANLKTVRHLPQLPRDASLPRKLVWHARDQWSLPVHVAMTRHLRRFRPDVVHTNECQGLSAAVFTAIAQVGTPHVHTAHDLNLVCARGTMTRDFEFCGGRCSLCQIQRRIRGGAVGRHIMRLIAVSDYIRQRHVEGGVVSDDRAIVLRLGAETRTRRLRALDGGGIHVGFIGTLAPHKGVSTLLSAFHSTPADWRLTIAGCGELQDQVVRAAGEDSRISYRGHVKFEEKERFFDDIHVLALPSEWEEPAALVGIEAIARGIPTIVSDRGGLPEIAEARVFRSRDAAALRAAISWFVDEPERLQVTSARLLDRSDEFSLTTHLRALESELERAQS